MSISPALLHLKNQTVLQLEKESKSDKDDSEKEAFKFKKIFDEDFVYTLPQGQVTNFTYIKKMICSNQPLYHPDHYTTVQTPPPDRKLV